MKYLKRVAALMAVLICFSALLCACKNSSADTAQSESEKGDIDYSNVNIDEYIGGVTYSGLTVTLASEDASKQDALWIALLENADIKSYPDEKVRYYFEQQKASYMYLVEDKQEDYEELLALRGISEDDMMADAREMVAKDLIYRYVLRAEQIVLTDEEKTELYVRYVDKYVSTYGYSESYVRENMSDMIYESMLYDKTMEYLILKNNFVVHGEPQN